MTAKTWLAVCANQRESTIVAGLAGGASAVRTIDATASGLPNSAAASLSQVSRDALRAGDLVFFNTLRRTFSHVGIYVGDGRFIHAPRSGARVRLERLDSDYWARRFTGARRAAGIDPR